MWDRVARAQVGIEIGRHRPIPVRFIHLGDGTGAGDPASVTSTSRPLWRSTAASRSAAAVTAPSSTSASTTAASSCTGSLAYRQTEPAWPGDRDHRPHVLQPLHLRLIAKDRSRRPSLSLSAARCFYLIGSGCLVVHLDRGPDMGCGMALADRALADTAQ